jgi:type IV pilus assembly protein PilQ
MFCKELLIASQSLLRSACVCALFLSVGTLADTHETRSRTVTKPNKSTEIIAETARPTTVEVGPPTRAAHAARLPLASVIRSVRISKDFNRGGQVLATIELNGQAQYNYFTLPSPYRLVVDVQNVVSEVPDVIQIGMADLKRVRLGKMDDSVRIVFDGTKPQPFQIDDDGTNIRIWFGEPKPAPTLAANPTPRNATQPNVAPLNKTLALAPKPVQPMATNIPLPAAKAPTVIAASTQPKAAVPAPSAPNVSRTVIPVRAPAPKPIPVQLPAVPKLSAKTVAARFVPSLFVRKFVPATKLLLTKNDDAPPPPKVVRPKTPIATKDAVAKEQPRPNTAPVQPSATTNATATKEARLLGKKGTARVVTATPTPITTPPTTTTTATTATTTASVKAPAPEKALTATNKPVTTAATIPNKTTTTTAVTPAVTPAVTAAVTPAAPPAPRPREVAQTPANPQTRTFNAAEYLRPGFEGDPINLDLRSTQGKVIDIRDFLRFITDTYKVNFVIDQSVREIPITVTLQNVPWNHAMEALLRANRLGVKVEGNILRVMSQETVALEDRLKQEQVRARQEATPLITEMVRLKYAKASTSSGGGGGGASAGAASASPAAGGGSVSGAGSTAGGSGLDGIITSRLSSRGKIQADPRTNTLIITDVPENVEAIKDIIVKLDVPEPQVEIESRIVIANRNFARDLGVQLGAVAIDTGRGGVGTATTLPNPPAPRVPINPASGAAGSTGGTASGTLFGTINDGLRAAGSTFGLGLTTGVIGTTQISAILTASEQKGNAKTISSPRITALNNQTANIVNGVQIPVQTESNNTLTVTFVTAALRLEITPQINDSGNVLLRVVAENNSVNTAIATRAAPGINTQRAETTVLVPDGGTTIIGGINIDVESNAQQRTPGVSRIPGLGELFKRRQVSRQTDEILFFITPRIYRPLDTPKLTTSSSQK